MLSNPDAALIALYAGLAAGFIVLAIVLVRNGTARYLWQVLRKKPQDLTPDVIKQYRSDAEALRKAAYLLELLSVALTLAWAWHARDSWLFSSLFCAGFIGFVWLKARAVPAATRAFIGERWTLASVLSLVSVGSLAMLLITSVFDATNTSDEEAQKRLEASNPAKALDEQISIARERLANLGAFADAERAHADEQKAEQANQQAQQHRAQVQTQLAQLQPPSLPSDMAKYMTSDCSPKRDSRSSPFTTRAAELCPSWQAMTADYQRQRAALESQLGIVTTSNSASYAEKHAEYLGQQQHLEGLLQQRSELSETGQGIKQAWRAEDRIIGEWLGVSPATANSIKWLLFAIAFDVISLLARVASALLLNQAGGDPQTEARRRFNAMVNSGIDANIAASLLTPPTEQPTCTRTS